MTNEIENYTSLEMAFTANQVTELQQSSLDDKPRQSDFFDVELLKQLSPKPKGKNCKFEKWITPNRSEIFVGSNEDNTQTRAGQTIFLEDVDSIKLSVDKNGWEYRVPQPCVSLFEKEVDGRFYKYILRNGRHRYFGTDDYDTFPCALMSGKTEYDLERLGATENAPSDLEKKREYTDADVIKMIRRGIECNVINKTLNAIVAELKELYPKVHTEDREVFANKVLNASGGKASFEPFNDSTAKKYLNKNFALGSFAVGGDKDNNGRRGYISAFNHPVTLKHLQYMVGQSIINHPDDPHVVYGYLKPYSSTTADACLANKTTLRNNYEGFMKRYVREHCIPLVELFQSGKLKEPMLNWFPQDNANESKGKWY